MFNITITFTFYVMDVHNEGEGLKDFVTTQFEPLNKKSMTEGLKNAQI